MKYKFSSISNWKLNENCNSIQKYNLIIDSLQILIENIDDWKMFIFRLKIDKIDFLHSETLLYLTQIKHLVECLIWNVGSLPNSMKNLKSRLINKHN